MFPVPINVTFARLTVLLVAVAALVAACGPAPTADEPPQSTPTAVALEGEAVIYVVVPLSGPQAEQGQAQAAGARLAASILNEQGGLAGQQIVIRTVNDRGTPAGARAAANAIAAEAASDNVVGVVVSESSDPALQAVQAVYLDDTTTPNPLVVVPASTSPLAADVNAPRFFRLSAPNAMQATEVAAAMREQNIANVVALSSPPGASALLGEQFTAAATTHGIDVLNSYEVNPDETDFTELAVDIFEQNPAGLFLATNPFESGRILSELYAIDYQGSIFAVDQALPYAVVDELGCQAEGLFRTSLVPTPRTAMTADQRQRYANQEGRVPEPFSVAGYAAVEFITAVYTGADTPDASAAAAYARANTVETLLGTIDFSGGTNLAGATMHFQQVQGRIFADEFARQVGLPPQLEQGETTTQATYLNLTFEASRAPIIFADLNWNSALFHNAIARTIIEAGYGYPTEAVPGSTVPSFQRLTRGEVDIVIERYNFDNTVAEAIGTGQIADLGVLFTDAVQGWFVPRYMVEGDNALTPDLQSVEQLERYANVFSLDQQTSIGAFYGGVPGWTAHKINCIKLKSYQLDDNYAQVTSESTGDLFGALATAYEAEAPILTYLWAPTSAIGRYDLVQLEEPVYSDECWATTHDCAYPTGDVKVLVHGDLPERAPEVAEFLGAFSMDISEVSGVLVRIEDESLTPDEAARQWLQANPDTWSAWVPADVAEQITVALSDA